MVKAGVLPGTDAAWCALAPGDVIIQVSDAPVLAMADLQRAIDQARAGGCGFARLLVEHKSQAMTPAQRPRATWLALRVAPP